MVRTAVLLLIGCLFICTNVSCNDDRTSNTIQKMGGKSTSKGFVDPLLPVSDQILSRKTPNNGLLDGVERSHQSNVERNFGRSDAHSHDGNIRPKHTMGKKRVAGLVIFRQFHHDIEYLMLKPSKPGKVWSPPKGRLDDGEDEYTAALRETEEEVGYTIDDLDIYRDQNVSVEQKMKSGRGKTKTVTFFLAELRNIHKVPRLSHEHKDYRWVNKDEATALYGTEFADMFDEFDRKISNNELD